MENDQAIRTEVVLECGQWVVYLLVLDLEGIERRRLSAHRSEREARLMADSAQRAANRRRRPLPEFEPLADLGLSEEELEE